VTATRFPELNDVLERLVDGARSVLGSNFVGAYLQGSFAVGDADEHSDVDFLVVVERELTEREQAELQALQEQLFALPSQWAQHLEGSYVPREQLRRRDPERRPWFYFDNGAVEPAWDPHDNTPVVRWSLREHGVVLAGPETKRLVDPVSADELRAEARRALPEFVAWAPEPTRTGGMSRWKQRLLVLSLCRILHTLDAGIVASKRKSGKWALRVLDPEWHRLIQEALEPHGEPWADLWEPADPQAAERTLAFCEFAVRASAGTPAADR
jgi:hypothetical protein